MCLKRTIDRILAEEIMPELKEFPPINPNPYHDDFDRFEEEIARAFMGIDDAGIDSEEPILKAKRIRVTEPYDHEKHRNSNWYKLYVQKLHLASSKEGAKYRRRFRMPQYKVKELVARMRSEKWFPHAEKPNACGIKGIDLEILVLGSLRYLGRGWTFDDLEESTGVDEDTHRKFFHDFVKQCAERLSPEWIKMPMTAEEIASCRREYDLAGFHVCTLFFFLFFKSDLFKQNLAGFHGCIGSGDCTHVIIEQISRFLKNAHKGPKLHCAARTFEIFVNHRRRIMSTTVGFPSTWNDKTVVKFDGTINAVRSGELYGKEVFTLENADGTATEYTGLWFLVDNGYMPISVLIPPFKHCAFYDEERWSKMAESLRKDVECTFGILKGRWRILKTGIRLRSLAVVDNIWKTCCCFHNMLLDIDGLTEDWAGAIGLHDLDTVREFIPAGLFRNLMRADENPRGLDYSKVVRLATNREHADPAKDEVADPAKDEVLRTMGQKEFRQKLVEHFTMKAMRHEVAWPTRR